VRLSVVVPARNEAGNVGRTVDRVCERLAKEGIAYEVVVVDDGSLDATAEEVQACFKRDSGVRLVQNRVHHGFGHAVRTGLDSITGDAVVIVMADGSDSPDDLVEYFYILRDRAECAFGSRFLPASRVIGYPPLKLAINRLANWLIRVLFRIGYNDVTNAFKGYRANVIEGCRPFLSPHFNLTVELPLKAIVRGYSYAVIPISWRRREGGVSRLRLKEMGSRYLFIVLHVWLEKLLTRGDYRRPAGETFEPWSERSVAGKNSDLGPDVS
jgi:dolichol-phosphate mannosyltransferase